MDTSKAVEGYLLDRQAGGYSSGTVRLYRMYLGILCNFLGDPPVAEIELADLQRFMAYLQNGYKPRRPSGDTKPLSPSAVGSDLLGIMKRTLGLPFQIINPLLPNEKQEQKGP